MGNLVQITWDIYYLDSTSSKWKPKKSNFVRFDKNNADPKWKKVNPNQLIILHTLRENIKTEYQNMRMIFLIKLRWFIDFKK